MSHPPNIPRWGRSLAALWIAVQAAACDSPTETQDPPDEPTGPMAHEVNNFVVGETATLRGDNLDEVSSVSVEGTVVEFERASSDRLSFDVPRIADCAVDGYLADIHLDNERALTARLGAEGTVSLEPGESRILGSEDLDCLKLPRGSESYVLTIADFATSTDDKDSQFQPPFTLLSHGTGEEEALAD